MQWQVSWAQAMVDFGAMGKTFDNVTLRMRPIATLGGDRLRLELDNRFGKEPVEIGHVTMRVGSAIVSAMFAGNPATTIAAGASVWTDSADIRVIPSKEIIIDVYFPGSVHYSTGNVWGAPFRVSHTDDFAGGDDFSGGGDEQLPVSEGQLLPLSAPLLRTIEVAGVSAGAVIVCLGDSMTVAGWPQMSAALLRGRPAVAVVNRGIAGNRLRFDSVPSAPMFGRSGLNRFEDDVLATAGVTSVVIALGTNDLGHPGTTAPIEELPTAEDLIESYRLLIRQASSAEVAVIIATIPPFLGAPGYDQSREKVRTEVNDWIRTAAPAVVDFDEALRAVDLIHLAPEYDSGDHLHPNAEGQARMARAMADAVVQ